MPANTEIQIQLDYSSKMINHNEDTIIDTLKLCILYAKWSIDTCKRDSLQLFLPYVQLVKDKLGNEDSIYTCTKKW